MNTEKMEIRAFNFEVRAASDEERGNYLEGTPIVYDSWTDLGWYDEMIDRGALNGTDLRDVRFLVNHNTDMIPLARSRNNNANSTMQLMVDPDVGMNIRVNLDTENNFDARALYSAVERGDISGMSFMFRVDSDKWEDIESEHPKDTYCQSVRSWRFQLLPSRHMKQHPFKLAASLMHWIVQKHRWIA